MKIVLLLLTFKHCFCDWVSEWLAPVEYQYKDFSTQNLSDAQFLKNPLNSDIEHDDQYEPSHNYRADVETFAPVNSPTLLKVKLEEILKNAKTLTETLKKQITYIENQERCLKEAIATGRSGTTTLTVTTLAQRPRTYFIRDGFWTLCNGIVQSPIPTQHNVFTELFSSPRCIGQEVRARRDFCAFNSLIKYETVPTTKRSTYIEDNYLCLKPSFNDTIETYMSVPKRIVHETCKNGVIKTLPENILDCGLRVLLEYSYYPNRSELASLPLEYCTEKDGACKLTIGWHLSNTSIQNFEFLKSENNFKELFIKTDHYLEPII